MVAAEKNEKIEAWTKLVPTSEDIIKRVKTLSFEELKRFSLNRRNEFIPDHSNY